MEMARSIKSGNWYEMILFKQGRGHHIGLGGIYGKTVNSYLLTGCLTSRLGS